MTLRSTIYEVTSPNKHKKNVFFAKSKNFFGRGEINREAAQVACFMERQEPEKTGAVF